MIILDKNHSSFSLRRKLLISKLPSIKANPFCLISPFKSPMITINSNSKHNKSNSNYHLKETEANTQVYTANNTIQSKRNLMKTKSSSKKSFSLDTKKKRIFLSKNDHKTLSINPFELETDKLNNNPNNEPLSNQSETLEFINTEVIDNFIHNDHLAKKMKKNYFNTDIDSYLKHSSQAKTKRTMSKKKSIVLSSNGSLERFNRQGVKKTTMSDMNCRTLNNNETIISDNRLGHRHYFSNDTLDIKSLEAKSTIGISSRHIRVNSLIEKKVRITPSCVQKNCIELKHNLKKKLNKVNDMLFKLQNLPKENQEKLRRYVLKIKRKKFD